MTEKVKARSFSFFDDGEGATFSFVLDDGRHFFIKATFQQCALANADLGNYVFKEIAKQNPERPFE